MNDIEVIARQAKQIEELRDEVEGFKERIRKGASHIYCIGGPLKDNRLGFTKEQIATFREIASDLGVW